MSAASPGRDGRRRWGVALALLLLAALEDPAVKAGLRCGPLTLPNHKLVPDARWIADLEADEVFARADDAEGAKADRGVALYVTSRFAIFKHALTDKADSALIEAPQPGWDRVAVTRYYAAYVRC